MAVTHLKHLPKTLTHTEDAKLFLSDGPFFIAGIKPCLFLSYANEEHVTLHMSQNLGLGKVGEGQELARDNRMNLRERAQLPMRKRCGAEAVMSISKLKDLHF